MMIRQSLILATMLSMVLAEDSVAQLIVPDPDDPVAVFGVADGILVSLHPGAFDELPPVPGRWHAMAPAPG